ncbi:30S ribosomal protein S13 [uncultured archaeon]|nr:30S ribosomal protein S13 [uncultured archaeon]
MAKNQDIKGNAPPKGAEQKEEMRGIVHLIGKDVKGQVPLSAALRQVKGVGVRLSVIFADIISKELSIPKDTPIGTLSEAQVDEVEKIVKNPLAKGVPVYLLNRRKDLETGKDVHISGSDVVFSMRNDIEREKAIYTWKGYRHAYGQKVRGQGTRTSGRKGLTMGVSKTKLKDAAAAAKAAPAKGAAPAAAPAKK